MKKNRTMKDLPVSERPYEKCWEYGPGVLSDAELLAVILRNGSVKKTAYELAVELLLMQRGEKKLGLLTGMTKEELTAVPGVGMVKAVQIICMGELARRLFKERAISRIRLASPRTVADYFMQDMKDLPAEEIRAAFFDTKSNLTGEAVLSRGTVNMSVITPREVFLSALSHRAVGIVLVHNHPSGDPTPSAEDIGITKRLRECGDLMGIRLLDHIIIGDGIYMSFTEQGMLK